MARTRRPVVLVRAEQQASDEHEMDEVGIPSAATAFRPVVLGLDIHHPDDELIEFAFDGTRLQQRKIGLTSGAASLPSSLDG